MPKKTFGHYLYSLRKIKGFTQKDLAKKAKIEFTYLSKLETNRNARPKEETIKHLSKALTLSEEERLKLYTFAKRLPPELEAAALKPHVIEILQTIQSFSEKDLLRILAGLKRRNRRPEHSLILA